MGTSTATLENEVYFRINQRLTTTQITPYLQRALTLITAAASYRWDIVNATPTPIAYTAYSDQINNLTTLDLGKKIVLTHAPTPGGWQGSTPIVSVSQDEADETARGYLDILGTSGTGATSPLEYNAFYATVDTNGVPMLELFPKLLVPVQVILRYHQLPPVLNHALPLNPTVRWTTTWMDDLLVEFAEMEIKRILNMSGWEVLEKRCQAKLAEAKKIYSTERETTGPPDEVQAAVVERDQIGRS